jgi:uncharacterized protein YqcC (DUF446 family)
VPGPFYFAWAGGVIADQVTVVTNGNTHGALFKIVALVGDTIGQQLRNLANTGGLQAGAFYQLAGPGIVGGTNFVFDDTILSGLPSSINLNATPTAEQSQTFTATQAVPVATALGALSQGSATVNFSGLSLAAGRYGIFGTGIGETDTPVNTVSGIITTTPSGDLAITTISACFIDYDGTSSGTMGILVASSHTTEGFDSQGEPTSIVTWTVTQQAVRATASGTFPLELSGFPSEDATVVDGIPAPALAGLDAGLVYNVSGNGIPVGATFVAPGSGTSITLSLEATASDQNAILTITGPRTPNAPFDPAAHARFDEDVISVLIEHEEGGLATLTIDIKNPNIGLLALGRNLWCWLSWDQRWPDGVPSLVPLFNGRLIGVPKLAAGEIVQLQFLARPDDLLAQKSALAESLSVLPYFDPIWQTLEPSDDSVLETYSALWHIDRTTLELSASDILEGEDGTIDVDESASIYEQFSLQYGQPPLVAVTVSGTVSWQQQASGRLDVTPAICAAFANTGSGYRMPFRTGPWGEAGGAIIQALCASGLREDWPKPGTSIGGGYTLSSQNDIAGYPLCYVIDASITSRGGWLQPAAYAVQWSAQPPPDTFTPTSPITTPYGTYQAYFALEALKVRMVLEYRADRKRTETVTAVVAAGVQRELSDSAEEDREAVSLTSEYVGAGVDENGALPIGSLAYRSYFQTERGAQSFEYLLLNARAKMRARARAVDITFAVPWALALGIGLRNNVRYTDRRVPGGAAIGKVKSYRLSCADGVMRGEFTIGCSIGTGIDTAPIAGTESYVDAGYVASGWQIMSGQQIDLIGGEIAYQTLDDFVVFDDGLDLTNLTLAAALNECKVTNGLVTQLRKLSTFQHVVAPAGGDPISSMKTMTTTCTLDLKPLTGAEFTSAFFPAVTPLTLPKTIDLAAS